MKHKHQQGLTLISLLIASVLLVVVVLTIVKVVPAMVEYWNIRKVVSVMDASGDLRGATIPDIRKSFDRRAIIDDITAIAGKDLEITRQGDRYVVGFRYEKRVPLFANVSLLFDFQGSSTSGRTRID